MSTTLVETFPFPQPHQIRVKDTHVAHRSPENNLSVSFTPPAIPYPVSLEEKCAIQLAHLASQHHGSEYNRMKFGPQGCPMAYVPLSIHMPDYVKELQARQTKYAEQKAWWPCRRQNIVTNQTSESISPPVLGPCGGPISNNDDLQQEISAAMAAPLESVPNLSTDSPPHPQLKTSDTHPINISMIIPEEHIPIISSYLNPSRKPSPTVFDIPPAYSLDRVTASQQTNPPSPPPRSLSLDRFQPYGSPIATDMAPPLTHWRTRSSVSEAIQAAINSGLAAASRDIVTPVLTATVSNISLGSYAVRPALGSVPQPKHSLNNFEQALACPTHGMEYERAYSAPPIVLNFPMSSPHSNLLCINTPSSHARCASNQQEFPASSLSTLTQFSYHAPFTHDTHIAEQHRITPVAHSGSRHHTTPPHSFSLGNILLSSCPGKKVRLTGPVKGRSGVCRDLKTDLRRMRDLGVGCVICCLDDTELEFLGVPWEEYSRAAQEIGVDVLRIPIPEGLTPPSPSSLDLHLTHVIKTYTMHGVSILAHCRGGVGRAGLIACCWMLKLGLCGWIETDLRYRSQHTTGEWTIGGVSAYTEGGVRRDTMQLVERVIDVVRRRRGPKAVETYEQVKFLVDYVEYLRESPIIGDEY